MLPEFRAVWRARGSIGRAPAHLMSRKQATRWSNLASQAYRPEGYDRALTAENVRKLCEEDRLTQAVEALGFLVQADCCISKSLFCNVLKKCAAKKDLVLGRRVHALIVKEGYESDSFLCNHILRMYAFNGRLEDAMDVFTVAANPDAFMWSSIISAHVKEGQDKQAIQLYRQMRRSGAKPDGHVFVATLQACARGADLQTGQELHADLLTSGIEPDLFVCNCLVDMYAKCGSLEEAHRVFHELGEKDVVTWTTLIAGYAKQGMGQDALRLYGVMQEEGVALANTVTFLCLLQACASVGTPALETGKELHGQIRERGHEGDVFVANSLVNMYAKCGSMENAQRVFDGLHCKDVVTWTALISGYSQQGLGQEALHLYSLMQEEGMAVPTPVTFVCLLQACATAGTAALKRGKQLHAEITKQGHQTDVVVANSLINMYTKCGSFEDARAVFDGLSHKDVVTWSAMIAGYSQQSMVQEALDLYIAMKEEGVVTPNAVTFVCVLQACAGGGPPALEMGKQLHAQIREQGHETDALVANSLVNMYAKCGSLKDAQRVFDALGQKDVVTWTALIAGHSQQGMGKEALCLYSAMEEDGMAVPDSVTFVCLLQACASMGSQALEKGRQLHEQVRQRELQGDLVVSNSLIHMYAKCGSLEDAQIIFDGAVHKDLLTWNAMIGGYSQVGMAQEAFHIYSKMQEEGSNVPNSVTFVCLLQACANVGALALEMGRHLHLQIREQGHQADLLVANSLVSMYAKCGSLKDAQRVFDGLGQKDVVTWTAMIGAYAQLGMGQEALHLYCAMQEEGIVGPDSVTFACILQACASLGTRCSPEDAQSLFDRLGQKDVVPRNAMLPGSSGHNALRLYFGMLEDGMALTNSMTFVCLLQACANVAALHLGRQLHARIEEQGLQADVFVASSLINMYGKSGSMVEAEQVFEELPERNVVTWNALIAGYSCQGDSREVFDLLLRMREHGIQPDGITFLGVLMACSHTGLVNKGREYFESMSRLYGITPTMEHYTCMVDLLGRAGQLDEALALVERMPVLPDVAVWYTLLCACQKWGNVKVGRHAFDQAVKLEKKDAAAYVIMSNIYTGAKMWEQAQEMHAMRSRMRAWKQPGQSWWTDMDGLVHSFVVGENIEILKHKTV